MSGDNQRDLALDGLVHDLNNIFDTIGEAGEVLASDAKWSRLAAAIGRSVERGRRIVESLGQTAAASFDFEDLVNSAITSTADYLESLNGPTVRFELDIELGIRVKGIAAAWERVLVNLLINAAQAMPDGGRVELHARREDGAMRLTVSDHGPGIPAHILPRIFEPDFSTKSAAAGRLCGLGLHIVQSLVKQNGGSVQAENRAAGAAFIVTAPLA